MGTDLHMFEVTMGKVGLESGDVGWVWHEQFFLRAHLSGHWY